MFQAKDGKKFGSSFAGRKYDESHSADGMHKMGEEHDTPGGEVTKEDRIQNEQETPGEDKAESRMDEQGEGKNPDADEQSQHPVAAEHGPAHKVVITHDEKSGRHTVTSHHKDGHMHTEAHDDAQKAHTAGKRLASVPEVENEKDAMSAKSTPPEESDGFQMPGLD